MVACAYDGFDDGLTLCGDGGAGWPRFGGASSIADSEACRRRRAVDGCDAAAGRHTDERGSAGRRDDERAPDRPKPPRRAAPDALPPS